MNLGQSLVSKTNQIEFWSRFLEIVDSLRPKSWSCWKTVENDNVSQLFLLELFASKMQSMIHQLQKVFWKCYTDFQNRIWFEFRFKCFGCDAFIVETCFQCNMCSNFYLCMGCYKSGDYPKRCVVFAFSIFF